MRKSSVGCWGVWRWSRGSVIVKLGCDCSVVGSRGPQRARRAIFRSRAFLQWSERFNGKLELYVSYESENLRLDVLTRWCTCNNDSAASIKVGCSRLIP